PLERSTNQYGADLSRFDLSDLGDYERQLFSRLTLGKYKTLVLRGEMGSGKSSAIDHVIEALRRPRAKTCGVCSICHPIIIKLNFNAGYRNDDIAALR